MLLGRSAVLGCQLFRSCARPSRMTPTISCLAQPPRMAGASGNGSGNSSSSLRRSPLNAAAYAVGGAAEADDNSGSAALTQDSWDKTTTRLVSISAAPFAVIAMPQVIQNFAAISAGNPGALSIISWEGITSGTFGNTLMSTHFAGRGEASALSVQLVSILNNFLILSQVAYTGHMPMPVFAAVAGAAGLAAGINVSKAYGWLPKESSEGFWRVFQLGSGIVGLSIMPQVMYSVLYPQSPSMLPAGIAFAAVCAWLYSKSRGNQKEFQSLLEALPGTSATMLFGLAPLPQLIKNFLDPTTLGGLSLGTLVLALVGNCLMFPRAIKTKDTIWVVGSVWANFAGWLTLLSLYLGTNPVTGLPFVDVKIFGAITAAMLSYFAFMLSTDAKVKGHRSVVASVSEIFGGPGPSKARM